MKRTLYFLLGFAMTLALAVFLSPLLFQVLPYKFERIFNRIVMIGVLVCALLFVRVRRETLTEYGLDWNRDSLRMLVTAFLTPVIVLSAYVAIQIALGQAEWSLRDIPMTKWVSRFFSALFAGLLIGLIEEFFFRGFIFKSTQNAFKNLAPALLVTNAFYSIVHFVNAKKPFVDEHPNFIDSLRVLGAPLQSLLHFSDYWPGFLGLLVFGVILSALYLQHRSLYPCIGLHAGAVFFLKMDGLFVNFGNNDLIWGSGKMYDGMIGWSVLLCVYFVLAALLKRFTPAK